MIIKEIKSKTIIAKSNLPGTDYVINPYVGCSNACIYCYARFMKKFTNHNEDWGQFVDVKINAPELIPNNDKKYKGKSFFMSSVTDPYLKLEEKYKITRQILERLINWDIDLSIQTKSNLILRDIDIIKKFKNCKVGLTLTTTDDNLRKEIEPFASSVDSRINVLKKLKENHIKTYVFIGPIMPYFSNWRDIIIKTNNYVDFYYFDHLNIKGEIWYSVAKWLKNNHLEYLKNYISIYNTNNNYWINLKKEIELFCAENNINKIICF